MKTDLTIPKEGRDIIKGPMVSERHQGIPDALRGLLPHAASDGRGILQPPTTGQL